MEQGRQREMPNDVVGIFKRSVTKLLALLVCCGNAKKRWQTLPSDLEIGRSVSILQGACSRFMDRTKNFMILRVHYKSDTCTLSFASKGLGQL